MPGKRWEHITIDPITPWSNNIPYHHHNPQISKHSSHQQQEANATTHYLRSNGKSFFELGRKY
jgi:hypothetical protein